MIWFLRRKMGGIGVLSGVSKAEDFEGEADWVVETVVGVVAVVEEEVIA